MNSPAPILLQTDQAPLSPKGAIIRPSKKYEESYFPEEIGSVALILDHLDDAIIIFTKNDETIIYVNPAWEQLNGYTLDEIRGQTGAFLHSSSSHTPWKQARAVIQHGKSWRGEVANRRADGTEYKTFMTITPLKNQQGESVYFAGVTHGDATKNALRQAQNALVNGLSHKLRTPLTNIKFYLSLLEKGAPDNRDRYMETLKRETKRLQAITNEMLLLSQFDMGEIEIYVEPIDLNKFISDLVTANVGLADAHEVEVRYAVDSDALYTESTVPKPELESDTTLLKELLRQLLTNAIVYTSPGGEIEITTSQRKAGDQRWCAIAIRDSGFGIDPSEQERIFERFYRGRSSYEMSVSGTGLGLAICKLAAEHLGGKIELESTLAVGSTFTILLPLNR